MPTGRDVAGRGTRGRGSTPDTVRFVYVVRHAKAAEESPDGSDHARPLTGRGRRQAAQVANDLASGPTESLPRLVLTSSAVRARKTAERLAEGLGGVETWVERTFYNAQPDDVVGRLRELDDDIGAVMVVGHNPTVHQLVLLLLSPDDPGAPDRFPTGAVAVVEMPAGRWQDLATGSGHLGRMVVPRH